jgi:putative ABC transport system permease protein
MPRWTNKLSLRLRTLFHGDSVDKELDAEIRFHLENLIEEYIAQGMLPQEARFEALRELGGVEQHKEECRDARGIRWLDDCGQDLRYALRILAKSPGFTILSVLMLALGIGANTAIVSTIDALIFRPMPYGQIDRLVSITPGSNYQNYLDIRAENKVFSDVAAVMGLPLEARTPNSGPLSGRGVSANFFQVLGLRMTLGRGFLPGEDALSGSQPVVVISHGLWVQAFASDPAILGKTLRLNGEPCVIVGVAPESFRDIGIGSSQDVWVPIPMFARLMHSENWSVWHEAIEHRDMYPWLGLIARLKSGVSSQQARARLQVLTSNLEAAYPGSTKNWHPTIMPENRARWPEGSVRYFPVILMAAGLCILLITCTNIANLLLARGSVRRREIATRLALGAGRGRIVRQLLAEGLVLSILALIVSLAVYELTLRVLPSFEDSIGTTLSLALGMDRRALFFAICIGILTNLMFGLAPALLASGIDLTGALKNQQFLSFRSNRIRWRRALVVFQMALTVILLTGAGLFIRTICHFESVDPGFDRNVMLVGTDFILSGGFEVGTADAETEAMTFYHQSLQQVRALPGIRSASWAEDLPFDRRGYIEQSISPEEAGKDEVAWLSIHCNAISAGHFKTLGIPIVQGHDFSDEDYKDPAGTVIVNETLARQYWHGESPLGKRIRVKDRKPELYEVVGVAKDLKYQNPWETARPYAYFPYWQMPIYLHMDLHVSVVGDPMRAIDPIRKACASVNPKVTMNNPRLMAGQAASLLSQERSAAIVLTGFGSLALVLAAVGLYGIISYSVTQRAHEFAIRIALGAQNGNILRQVILEGMILVALGLAIGLPCCMALSKLVVSRMHGLSPLDPAIYILVPVISFSVALSAIVLPARRAAAYSTNALRVE